ERHLPRVLIRSHDERRATASESLLRRTVLDVPIPARRAWIDLEPGVLVASPGQVWPAERGDPRRLPAFAPGLQASAPTWLPPAPDIQGHPVVTVVLAIPGADGTATGVAAVEIDAGWMTEQLLVPEVWRSQADVRGRLLDAEGRVVLSTTDEPTGVVVDDPALTAAIAERRSGQTLSGGRRILHHRLASNGWWSIVDAPLDTPLGE
ncbi:MAG: cache domain-containing protein, partial [Myxococcales bacterium]|nr:cache domain-containing protein [Myxococcales bacterium]